MPNSYQNIVIIFIQGVLKLYTRNKFYLWGILCCNGSVVTFYGTYTGISHVKCLAIRISGFRNTNRLPHTAVL